MSYGKKEVRSFIKFLKSQVLSIENLGKNKHFHLNIKMKNKVGEIVTIPKITIPSTPSDENWRKLKMGEINRVLRTHNIKEIRR